MPTNRITGIVSGDRAVTADTALRLSRFFGTSAEFSMNLQVHYDLQQVPAGEIEREIETFAATA